jgi:transcription elongation factor GreA
MDRVPITPAGAQRLQQELAHLKEKLRPSIVRDIEEARAHGDISENAEFEDAKHRQALCEARIAELSGQLALLEVIDVRRLPASDRVVFGTTVVLLDQESEEEVTYRVVGNYEADARAGLISVTSPIGRALIGRCKDDEVVVQTPRGTRRFVISEVHYR